MSFQANRRQSQPNDGGYALPIVIVVIAVGAMVAIALLGYAAALLKAGADDADSLLHLYAADAGIAEMKKHLEDGKYPAPVDLMVGGIEVKVKPYPPPTPTTPDHDSPSVTRTSTATPMPTNIIFPEFLPERNSSVTIKSVPLLENSVLNIRWATTTPTSTSPSYGHQNPPYTAPSIKVYRTSDWGAEEIPTPTPIATSVLCPDHPRCFDDQQDDSPEDYIWVRYKAPSTGDVRIVFYSGTEKVGTQVRSPSCPGENGKTRCVIAVPVNNPVLSPGSWPELQEDYVVVSTADRATVTAYIRRIIGWRPIHMGGGVVNYERYDEVTILSWKPYPPDPPNSD